MNQLTYNIYTFLGCFSISAIFSFSVTPYLTIIGRKYKFFDYPSVRKRHKKELVNIGGISLFIGIFVVIIFSFFLMKLNLIDKSGDFFTIIPILFFANLIIFTTGFYDDKHSLSPTIRLIIQLSAASLMWLFGLRVELLDFTFLFSNLEIIYLPKIISYTITVIWIGGIINGINWLDGMDGLAAGVSFLIASGMIIIGFYLNNNLAIIFATAIAGACLGFLIYNLPPAKIIMGDAGSNLLGFNLAITSIVLFLGNEKVGILPFSFIIFLVPIIDMLKVIFLRISKGYSPFRPDRNHLHFQLLRRNFSEKSILLLIYLLVLLSLSLSLIPFDLVIAIPALISFISAIIILISYNFFKNKSSL